MANLLLTRTTNNTADVWGLKSTTSRSNSYTLSSPLSPATCMAY